jgi:hypothetical protein
MKRKTAKETVLTQATGDYETLETSFMKMMMMMIVNLLIYLNAHVTGQSVSKHELKKKRKEKKTDADQVSD